MDAPAPSLPPILTFAVDANERARLQRLARRRIDAAQGWNSYWAVLLAMIFVIGFVVFGLHKAGLVPPSQMKAVLATAYAAFASGVALTQWLGHRQWRRLERRNDVFDGVVWNIAFSDAGFVCKSALFETRIPWHTVRSVEPWPGAVFIWLETAEPVTIPARVFANDATCLSFVAAVRACIDKAKAAPDAG
ncbi:hypothetical protein MXD81_39725 [Microbacteriaceae bacterium K1510]|nr:hypothetical protein [Microbacteriaceae bacterium K1510]